MTHNHDSIPAPDQASSPSRCVVAGLAEAGPGSSTPATRRRARTWCPTPRLVLLTLVLLFTACGRRETFVDVGLRTQTLHTVVSREPGALDPHFAGGDITPIIDALFEGLVCLANDGVTIRPGVAERWEMSPDGKTYTFHLRANARWSNGDPITATDFRASFLRFLDPQLRSLFANDIFMIAGAADYAEGRNVDPDSVAVRAPDPRTLVISLAHPCAYFLLRMAEREVRPVHMPSVERFGGRQRRGAPWDKPGNLVSNGPFMLAEWRPQAVLVVRKNPNYWDAARVRLNEIRFQPISDVATAERAFRAGQLHLSPVPPTKRPLYRDQPDSPLHTVTQSGTRLLRLQTTRPPFTDARVRRALSLALDREKLVTHVLAGFGVAAHSQTMPGTGGYEPKKLIAFDAAEARRLLAEAGYAGGTGLPPVELLISGHDGETTALAEALQQMWREVLGVTVAVAANEGTVFLDRVRAGDFQISLTHWRYDINDPVDQLILGVASYPSNQTGWKNADYERAFVRSEEAASDAERRTAFDEMESLLAAEAPFIPLLHAALTTLVHPQVHGWRDNSLGAIDWRDLWLEAPR